MLCKRNILLALIVLASLLAASAIALRPAPVPDRWDQQAQKQTIEAAQPLIEAINAYKLDRGNYPNQLEELVPEYLDQIPQPIVGSGEWSYGTSKFGFSLYVESANNEPPPLIWMLLFGRGGYDDRSFKYSSARDTWGIADL